MTIEVEALLKPSEVAALFGVDPKTVTRWAKTGRLASFRTPGGHRRYREADVRMFLGTVRPADAPRVEAPTVPMMDADVYARNNRGGRP